MKIKITINKQRIAFLFICFFMALTVSFIRWEKISASGEFWDREVYRYFYQFVSNRVERFVPNSIVDYITNEWLWLYINEFSKEVLQLSPELFFGLITFISFFTYSYFILENTKKPLLILYLINIEFISFIYSQLRLALAMSVFVIAIKLFEKKYRLTSIFFFISSFLIHTSLVLFTALLIVSIIISRINISILKKMVLIILVGLLVNLLISPFREVILDQIGDRRAEYNDFTPPLYWYLIYVFYAIFMFFITLRYRLNTFDNYIFNYAFIIFSLLISSLALGGYTSRFVVATTLFIIPTLFLLKGRLNILFQYIYIVYLIFLWIGFLT